MITRLTTLAAAACLFWRWDQRRRESAQRTPLRTVGAKPEAVTTWEGEGGALPTTGAQTGPGPAQP